MRGRSTAITFVCIMLFTLTACGGTQPAPAAGGSTGQPSPGGSTQPAPQAQPAGPIKIGVVTPISGPVASYAALGMNGIKLAVKQINAAGGVNGQQIELVVEDDKSTPEGGVASVRKVIDRDGVRLIIGTLQTDVALAERNVTNESKVLQIVTAQSGQVTQGSFPLLFAISATIDSSVAQLIKQVVGLGAKSIGIIAEQSDLGETVIATIKKALAGSGAQVTAVERFQPGTADFSTQLTNLRKANPDAVVSVNSSQEGAGKLWKQAFELGLRPKFKLVHSGLFPGLIQAAGNEAAEGLMSVVNYDTSLSNPTNKALVDAWTKEYGKPPATETESMGYENIWLLAEAIKKAGNTEPDKVAAALKAGTWQVPRGELKFGPDGRAETPQYLIRVHNGNRELMNK